KLIVGANEFVIDQKLPEILYIDHQQVADHQAKKLKVLRAKRSNDEVKRRLEVLKKAAAQQPVVKADGKMSDANTMPYIIDAVRAYASVGEICQALREVYGTYEEVSIT